NTVQASWSTSLHRKHGWITRESTPVAITVRVSAHALPRHVRSEGGVIFSADPGQVPVVYGAVLRAPDDAVTRFIGERLRHPDDRSALARARELLELERHALRMFTSCGWFFDDIEIGRASCRERGEIWAGAGALE